MDVCVSQVGQAKDSSLTSQLIDYLMGESDGIPKVINTLEDLDHCFILFKYHLSSPRCLSFSLFGVCAVSLSEQLCQWVGLC